MQLSIFEVEFVEEDSISHPILDSIPPKLTPSAIAYWQGRANYYRKLIERFFWSGQNGTPPLVTRALIASAWQQVLLSESHIV